MEKEEDWQKLDREKLVEASKPLFYGFIVLSAFSIGSSPSYAGSMLGIAIMASLVFVSTAFMDVLDERYRKFVSIISVMALLTAVLSASYMSLVL